MLRSAQDNQAAAAAENGVGGTSIAALTAEPYSRDVSDNEIELQTKGMQTETQSRLNNIQQPSLLTPLLQTGGAAVSAYNTYYPPQCNRDLAIPGVQ